MAKVDARESGVDTSEVSYRGRLIWPFFARLAPLDPKATEAAVAPGAGFDDVFREPRQVPAPGVQQGEDARAELDPVDLPCQVEDEAWETLRMLRSGASPQLEVLLVFHFRDLELRGLVDADTGTALLPRIGDRLVSIHRSVDLALVQAVPTPPGLYCVEAKPRSYGLSGLSRNLLVCTFRARARASEKV